MLMRESKLVQDLQLAPGILDGFESRHGVDIEVTEAWGLKGTKNKQMSWSMRHQKLYRLERYSEEKKDFRQALEIVTVVFLFKKLMIKKTPHKPPPRTACTIASSDWLECSMYKCAEKSSVTWD